MYEKQCMSPTTWNTCLSNLFREAISLNKSKYSNHEDSESEYEPKQDGTLDGDLFDDNEPKKSKRTSKKTSKKRSADIAPGGIKPRAKRVLVDPAITRATRSKKLLTLQDGDASDGVSDPSWMAPSVTPQPTSSPPHNTQPTAQDDGNHQHEEHTHMASEECNSTTQLDNQIDNIVDDVVQADQQVQIDNDIEEEGRCVRGHNMGKGLQKLSRARRGKLPVVIPEGRIRPVVPLVAAKFATECNIAVRNHVPVFKHWKMYKKKPEILQLFVGKLGAKFDMDTCDAQVEKACCQMMKSAVRQQRYRLKKKYFDPFPLHLVPKTSPVKSLTDEEWNDLVEYWKNPTRIATSEKNKVNRGKVKFHQATGSRSYMVHLNNLGEKYKNEDPNALNLFKECHYSKKKQGYAPSVQSAITKMETMIAEPTEVIDAEPQPKRVTEVVAHVLAEHTKKCKFLQNVGIQDVQPRSNVQTLQAELAVEKRANGELQLLVTTQREQIDVLSVQLQEAEQTRVKDKEEMQKQLVDTNAKLELLLGCI